MLQYSITWWEQRFPYKGMGYLHAPRTRLLILTMMNLTKITNPYKTPVDQCPHRVCLNGDRTKGASGKQGTCSLDMHP